MLKGLTMKALTNVLICTMILLSASSWAEESITINFNGSQIGPATACGNGFWGKIRDGFPDSLVSPLRPSAFSGGIRLYDSQHDSTFIKMQTIAAAEGDTAYFLVGLSNGSWTWERDESCGFVDGGESTLVLDPDPSAEDPDMWDCWIDTLIWVTDSVEVLRDEHPRLKFHYSIWGEANLGQFWYGDSLEFYRMWEWS